MSSLEEFSIQSQENRQESENMILLCHNFIELKGELNRINLIYSGHTTLSFQEMRKNTDPVNIMRIQKKNQISNV